MGWIRKTYRSLVRQSLTIVTVVSLGIGLFGRPVVRLWAGSAAVPSGRLLWVMAFWAILVSITSNQALLLSAVGRLKLETSVAVLAAVANLALSIYLVQRVGSIGVIIATIVSFLLLMLGPQQWEVRRVLEGRYVSAASPQSAEIVRV